jgi:hypothetical protein
MGWVENRMKNLSNPEEPERDIQGNGSAEGLAEQQWQRLVRGFELDVEEFNSLGECGCLAEDVGVGMPDFEPGNENLCRRDRRSAGAEDGILTLRRRPGGVDLYSSDEHLTLEQVRQEILSPVFFPTDADELEEAS